MDDIRPLKDVLDIKGGFSLGLFAALVLLVAAGIWIFIYLRRKKKITEAPPAPPRPCGEAAMEALRLLNESGLKQKGMIKEYYIRLSDIIRIYIEGRFGILSMDMTTWELYQEMRRKKIERRCVDKIRDFLEDCDLVKFAKYTPAEKEIEEAHRRAEQIVEMTKSEIRISTLRQAQGS